MERGNARAERELPAVEAAWRANLQKCQKTSTKRAGQLRSRKITLVDVHMTQRSRAATQMVRSGRSGEQDEKWREG
jgi:hypothetical protein